MPGHVAPGGMGGASNGPFVGRDELMDELVETAANAARGRGSIILLTGEAGIGKTSVARMLAQRVGHELVVTWGTCVADQSAPPFWPWRPFVALEPSALQPDTGQAIGEPRFEQLSELRDQLQAQTREEPRLHIIEDLQWADVASVLLLGHLVAAIPHTPLLVVATLRTGESLSPQLDSAIEDVRRGSLARELPALGERDIASLIRATGAVPDDALVDLVLKRTAGNPLLVRELLRSVPLANSAQRQLATVTEMVPARVSDMTRLRLTRLPPAVADALITASVIGSEGDTSALAKAHGSDHLAILDLLDQARAAGFLDTAPAGRWRFRHQLIRDAVYASDAASSRALRHARVLEALAADPSAAPPTIAHHALAALPRFDADRAVALAARAGEVAFAHHAYEEAVDWFTRALAAAPAYTAPRWRAELLVLSGEAHRQMGEVGAARRAFVRVAELTDDPALLARAALGYADQGAVGGGPSTSSRLSVRSRARRTTSVMSFPERSTWRATTAQPATSREVRCTGSRRGTTPGWSVISLSSWSSSRALPPTQRSERNLSLASLLIPRTA